MASSSNQVGGAKVLVNFYLVEHQHQCLALDVHHRSAAAIIDDHPSLSAPAAIVWVSAAEQAPLLAFYFNCTVSYKKSFQDMDARDSVGAIPPAEEGISA